MCQGYITETVLLISIYVITNIYLYNKHLLIIYYGQVQEETLTLYKDGMKFLPSWNLESKRGLSTLKL